MSTAAYVYLVLAGIEVGFVLGKHGTPRTPPVYSFPLTLFSWLVITGILYWGGFFSAGCS